MQAAWIHGFILAIGLILPLGVQNFFIFSQGAVRNKFIYMLPIVFVASLCDTLLILAAVLGVSAIVNTLVWMRVFLVISGFIFLIYMGIQSWRSSSQGPKQVQEQYSLKKTMAFTLMISLMNPHAILDTVGVIGTSSIQYQGVEKVIFTGACITVSWCWFFLLALLGRFVGINDKSGHITTYLNKISAIVMWLAALYLLKIL
jgi:L-lysine exporter family protein LysE/ArgO